jgi:radical SAM superfamily enzyme YgiQ (UPF0313 family)
MWLCHFGNPRLEGGWPIHLIYSLVSQESVFRSVGKLRSAGINVIGNFIFGLPEDDLASMRDTLELALDLRCDFANFYSTMDYPGSPLYEEALRQEWPLPATWSGYSQHAVDALPLPTRHLSGPEVLAFRDQAFHRYYEDEGYLAYLENRFGPEVRRGVEQMTSVKLERQAG